MRTLDSISALRSFVADSRKSGKTIALVPTMGALHDGHIELVRQGLARADICIPSIFVNPMQFAPTEDLASYPRTLAADLEKLRAVKAGAVYLPRAEEMYPEAFATKITLSGVALPLEGERRPIMFDGVATVVAKLLLQCLPDIAIFGEKDWQQLQVIKRMVRDLDIPVEILGAPIVRDENGLALSSRNAYLSADQYKIAIRLNKILYALASDVKAGTSIPAAGEKALAALQNAGFDSIDYVTVRDAQTLQEPEKGANLRVLAAVRLGKARLIDNIPL
jgi:pantoate--beta-alanine ligase